MVQHWHQRYKRRISCSPVNLLCCFCLATIGAFHVVIRLRKVFPGSSTTVNRSSNFSVLERTTPQWVYKSPTNEAQLEKVFESLQSCPFQDHQAVCPFEQVYSSSRWEWYSPNTTLAGYTNRNLTPFTVISECLNGRIVAFGGDSGARQQIRSMLCWLRAKGADIVPASNIFASDVPFTEAWHIMYGGYRMTLAHVCGNFSASWGLIPFLLDYQKPHWEARNPKGPSQNWESIPLHSAITSFLKVFQPNYFFLSIGSWFHPSAWRHSHNSTNLDAFAAITSSAIRQLNEANANNGTLFIFRSAPISHFVFGDFDTEPHGICNFTQPFLQVRPKQFSQGENFQKMHEILSRQASFKSHFRVLDPTMLSLRGDAHPNHRRDCLHFCQPGPLEAAADELFRLFWDDCQAQSIVQVTL